MSKKHCLVIGLAALGWTGCTSHLVFVEEDHVGLKAKFQPNDPAPAQFSVGYHRGVVAVVPQQGAKASGLTNQVTVTRKADGTNVVVQVVADPDELMSLYTVFRANVGWRDPVETLHFLATGTAAAQLLANEDELRNVADVLTGGGNGTSKGTR